MQAQTVERAMHGDHDAFASLAAGSVDRCYGLAYRILCDQHRAEDATQQALLGGGWIYPASRILTSSALGPMGSKPGPLKGAADPTRGSACRQRYIRPRMSSGFADPCRLGAGPITRMPRRVVAIRRALYVASIGREPHPHMFVVAVEAVGPDPLQTLSAWEAQVDPIIDSILVPYIIVDN